MTTIRMLESNGHTEHFQVLDDDGSVVNEVRAYLEGSPPTKEEKEFAWMAGEFGYRGAATIVEAQERVKKNLAADPNYYDQFDWPMYR